MCQLGDHKRPVVVLHDRPRIVDGSVRVQYLLVSQVRRIPNRYTPIAPSRERSAVGLGSEVAAHTSALITSRSYFRVKDAGRLKSSGSPGGPAAPERTWIGALGSMRDRRVAVPLKTGTAGPPSKRENVES